MTGWHRIAVFTLLAGMFTVASSRTTYAQGAEKGVFGLGLILGEPTGVSAKLYLSDDTAVDLAAGGAILGGGIQVHADYLWHPWVLEQRDDFVLPAYIGVGMRVLDHDRGTQGDVHVGLRGAVGMLFDFKTVPIDVFVEVAPVLDVVLSGDDQHDGVDFDINGGLGVRYYF